MIAGYAAISAISGFTTRVQESRMRQMLMISGTVRRAGKRRAAA